MDMRPRKNASAVTCGRGEDRRLTSGPWHRTGEFRKCQCTVLLGSNETFMHKVNEAMECQREEREKRSNSLQSCGGHNSCGQEMNANGRSIHGCGGPVIQLAIFIFGYQGAETDVLKNFVVKPHVFRKHFLPHGGKTKQHSVAQWQ